MSVTGPLPPDVAAGREADLRFDEYVGRARAAATALRALDQEAVDRIVNGADVVPGKLVRMAGVLGFGERIDTVLHDVGAPRAVCPDGAPA